ncbi:MAG: tyrosine-type recombinase/integrase [Methanotrichaceae archaeon]|nr:tyrosine-type recombinase/integrase [Methanotrichaceae archaeon]
MEDMTKSHVSDGVNPSPSAVLIDGFIYDCGLQGMSPSTIERYISSIRAFSKFIESRGLDFKTAADIEVMRNFLAYFRLDRKLSQKTIENTFTALFSFYKYLKFERYIEENPVSEVRERYIRRYKDNDEGQMRKLISIEDMGRLINSTLDIRDKAIIALFAKTGIRRNELISLDISDINFEDHSIKLKPARKRTNRTVFFDDEMAVLLHRWIRSREGRNKKKSPALFINAMGDRLERHGVYQVVSSAAERIGLHDPSSDRMEDHFSPHCCRHWFTTHLRRAGMPREFIQELRGDARREAIDIYDHIDPKELKESYLAYIPQLGI